MPRRGRPLSAAYIAGELRLAEGEVVALLEDLEARMTFLFRNETGAVTRAYPVTVAPTPHRMTFSSGEQIDAV